VTNAYKISVGKTEGKRLHGRHRPTWEDNIKKILIVKGWEDVAQDKVQWRAVVNMVMSLPSCSI
jgi:hypothetical protein